MTSMSSPGLKANEGGGVLKNHTECLPREIFQMILGFMDSDSVFQSSRVCSSWRKIILNMPSLWTSIDLSNRNFSRSMSKLEYWIQRLKVTKLDEDSNLCTFYYPIRSMKINCSEDSEHLFKILRFISEVCSSENEPLSNFIKLESFVFNSTDKKLDQVDFSVLGTVVYLNRKSLVELSIESLNSITIPIDLESFLNCFPRLKVLNLRGCSSAYPLEFFDEPLVDAWDMKDEEASDLIFEKRSGTSSLPSLESMSLSFLQFFEDPGERMIKLPSLRRIRLNSVQATQVPAEEAGYLIDVFELPNLEELELSECDLIQEQDVSKRMISIPKLKSLKLSSTHTLSYILECLQLFFDSFLKESDKKKLKKVKLPKEPFGCLESIELDNDGRADPWTSYQFLAIFSSRFTNLRSLVMTELMIEEDTEPMLLYGFKYLPPLERIGFIDVGVTNEILYSIKLGRMERLEVTFGVDIRFETIKRFVRPELRYLRVERSGNLFTKEEKEFLTNNVETAIV